MYEMLFLDESKRLSQVEHISEWPQQPAIGWYRGRFPDLDLQIDDLPYLEEVASPFNDELKLIADSWIFALEAKTIEKWHRGEYARAPLSLIGTETEKGFYIAAPASHGWAAQVALRSEECPEMMEMVKSSLSIIERRDKEIRRVLRKR